MGNPCRLSKGRDGGDSYKCLTLAVIQNKSLELTPKMSSANSVCHRWINVYWRGNNDTDSRAGLCEICSCRAPRKLLSFIKFPKSQTHRLFIYYILWLIWLCFHLLIRAWYSQLHSEGIVLPKMKILLFFHPRLFLNPYIVYLLTYLFYLLISIFAIHFILYEYLNYI